MRAQEVLADTQNEIEISGMTVRKGTVGAFLANATVFTDPATTTAERDVALQHIEDALPGLQALGFFEVLEIRDAQLRAFVVGRTGADSSTEA